MQAVVACNAAAPRVCISVLFILVCNTMKHKHMCIIGMYMCTKLKHNSKQYCDIFEITSYIKIKIGAFIHRFPIAAVMMTLIRGRHPSILIMHKWHERTTGSELHTNQQGMQLL